MVAAVSPVLQRYVAPPVAVSVVLKPWHISEFGPALAVTLLSTKKTVMVSESSQPLEKPVTE